MRRVIFSNFLTSWTITFSFTTLFILSFTSRPMVTRQVHRPLLSITIDTIYRSEKSYCKCQRQDIKTPQITLRLAWQTSRRSAMIIVHNGKDCVITCREDKIFSVCLTAFWVWQWGSFLTLLDPCPAIKVFECIWFTYSIASSYLFYWDVLTFL